MRETGNENDVNVSKKPQNFAIFSLINDLTTTLDIRLSSYFKEFTSSISFVKLFPGRRKREDRLYLLAIRLRQN